ncbi:MAG: glycosyltransferase family 2 protein [Candidatus Nanopelagicales bacterium]
MNGEVNCSVVVAARDEETYLAEALRSILDQEGVNVEVVLVDDHSRDATTEVARALAGSDERLRLFHNPREGKCSAFNLGVAASRAEYVCLFAGDDVMPPGSLRARIESVRPFGDERAVIGLAKIRTISDDPKFNGVVVPKTPGLGNPSGASIMMNRRAVDTVFPVPESLPSEDTWMALAATHLHKVCVVHSDVIACDWRVHAGNTSANMTEDFEEYSRKIAERMVALDLFLEHYRADLTQGETQRIRAKQRCERMRRRGSMLGVLTSRVAVVDRLRALSSTNPFLYRIRRTFYSTLSGR